MKFQLLSISTTSQSACKSACLSICPNFDDLEVCFIPYLSIDLVMLLTSFMTVISSVNKKTMKKNRYGIT